MDETLAATYKLVYAFLIAHSHSQVARALKGAVKDIVILKDDATIEMEGPQLERIVKEWMIRGNNTTAGVEDVEDSETSISSSSESESESSSVATVIRVQPVFKALPLSPSSSPGEESDSDVTNTPRGSVKAPSRNMPSLPISWNSGSDESCSESDSDESSNPVQAGRSRVRSSERASSQTLSSETKPHSDDSEAHKKKSKAKGANSSDVRRRPIAGTNHRKSQEEINQNKKARQSPPVKNGAEMINKKEPFALPWDEEDSEDDEQYSRTAQVTRTEYASGSSDSDTTRSRSNARVTKTSPRSSRSPTSESSDSAFRVSVRLLTKRNDIKGRDDTSSSSEDSSASESSSVLATVTIKAKPSASERASGQYHDDRAAKKRRTTENGAAVTTATVPSSQEEELLNDDSRNGKKPFKRVDPDKIPLHNVKDNRYEAKAGPSGDYGQKAHHDLIVTRGAGFRKEKNKKKRGSYRGGAITMESHSFKFAD